jgi:hypothetical protein
MLKWVVCALGSSLLLGACSDGDGGKGEVRAKDGGLQPVGDGGKDTGWDGHVPSLGDVRLNELDCTSEAVELFNAGTTARDLGDFAISNTLTSAGKYEKLSGSIAPGEHKVIRLASVSIKCSGEDTFLTQASVLVDVAPRGTIPGGATWGRLPDATGVFAATTPTLGALNTAWQDTSATLFSPFGAPAEISLQLDEAAQSALRTDPRTYVKASITVRAGTKSVGPISVGVRLKGSLGSFRDLDSKPALKIDADRYVPGQRIFGQAKLTLNNFAQDPSTIHEWLGYQIYGALGVPAPRLSYANLTLNTASYGTYLLLEDNTSSAFLGQAFKTTQGLYEPAEGADLVPEQVPTFDVKQGSSTDFSALLAIAEPTVSATREQWFTAIKDKVDFAQVLRVQATDIIAGDPDGYSQARNNYLLHLDDAGVLRMMPWGIDASFSAPMPFLKANGRLLARCFEDKACTALWLTALDEVQKKVKELSAGELLSNARKLAGLNAQRFASDTHWDHVASEIVSEAEASIKQLNDNLDRLADALTCQRSGTDADGDGHRCDLDCDDEDPTRYRGAKDLCGDRIDQSCNGIADDDPSCPACVSDASTGLIVCPRAMGIDALRSACQALSARPVSIGSAEENARVHSAVQALSTGGALFTGLSDEATADSFVWSDRNGGTYRNFSGGFPFARNPGQAARCGTILADDGTWQTELCTTPMPGVCKR